MKIKKMYQGEVPENKIVGTYTESNTDTYNCSYVNNSSIVESGTNYVKYGDGTMFCWGETGSFNCNGYSGITKYCNLPQSFVNTNYKVISAINITGAYWASCQIASGVQSNSQVWVNAWNNASETAGLGVSYIAIGKWK